MSERTTIINTYDQLKAAVGAKIIPQSRAENREVRNLVLIAKRGDFALGKIYLKLR